jgi:hypothetical protein
VFAICLAVIGLIATPVASANDERDKKTTITTNVPFEVPGRVLPAGTYVLKIVDIAGVRNIVRFYSPDEKTIYTTVIGIPDFRLDPPEKANISFYEVAPGAPLPMHAWFYPGSQFGIEFAYPKHRAVAIARATEEHVIALPEPEAPAVASTPPDATVEELLEEPLVAIEPSGAEVEIAEVHPEQPTAVAEATAENPVLPRTGTLFPLIGVLGLLAAGAATRLGWRS